MSSVFSGGVSAGRTLIIAEAGVNHNGSIDRALELVDAAKEAGADIVKFQTFRASKLVSKHAEKARYQVEKTGSSGSQLEMLKALELSDDAFLKIQAHAKSRGIGFLSTPFDDESLDFILEGLRLPAVKLGSGDLTNAPLLLRAARAGRELLLSTGMATMEEVREAVGVAAYGFLHPGKGAVRPRSSDFLAAFSSEEGQRLVCERVTLFQCTTEYPAPFEETNLRAMEGLRREFGTRVGFSDHTPGISMPIAAVALGAQVIEKHFTLDRKLPGPDHSASLEPAELAAMVRGIRETEVALGTGEKSPGASELPNRAAARKSLVAASAIRMGEPFTESNLTVKRPGGGIAPSRYWEFLSRESTRDYAEDEKITE